MKTNKLLAGMLTATLVATSIGTSFAMYGEGREGGKKGHGHHGKGKMHFLTDEQKAKLESMSREEKREYFKKLKEEHKAKMEAMTDEERKAYHEERVKKFDEKFKNMSDEDKTKFFEKIEKGGKRGGFLTEDQKTEMKTMTNDEKYEYLKKIKEEYRAKIEAMTDEERKAYMEEKRTKMKEYRKGKKGMFKGKSKNKLKRIGKRGYKKGGDIKANYKEIIKKKFAKRLENISDDKAKTIISKIDTKLEKINSSDIDETKKSRLTNLLGALKEVLEERFSNDETNEIEELLK